MHLLAIFGAAVTPGIAAAQLPTLTDTGDINSGIPTASLSAGTVDAERSDKPITGGFDGELNELVRRLDQQERELNDLRQLTQKQQGHASSPSPAPATPSAAKHPISVALLNSVNYVKLHAGLDTLMVFSTSRPFPSGTPLFLLPDSPFGLNTNTFNAHARQRCMAREIQVLTVASCRQNDFFNRARTSVSR